jgi:hypothetical protein
VPVWHIACKSARAAGGVLVRAFKMKVKTINSPKQLTVTTFCIKITQLLELKIPCFFPRHAGIETNFVKHPFSFLIHYAISEVYTLLVYP